MIVATTYSDNHNLTVFVNQGKKVLDVEPAVIAKQKEKDAIERT